MRYGRGRGLDEMAGGGGGLEEMAGAEMICVGTVRVRASDEQQAAADATPPIANDPKSI